MQKKYTPGRVVTVLKNPPGIEPVDCIKGRKEPIEDVKTSQYIQVAGYRFDYVTARKFLKVTESDEENF